MNASFYKACEVHAWIHDAINVDDLVGRLKFFDGRSVFLLQIQKENSVADSHLQKAFV